MLGDDFDESFFKGAGDVFGIVMTNRSERPIWSPVLCKIDSIFRIYLFVSHQYDVHVLPLCKFDSA